jgi:hypothetical protein
MDRILALATGLILGSLAGCSPAVVTKIKSDDGLATYDVVKIDGCEYIQSYGSHGEKSLCHKGNCSSPVHVYSGKSAIGVQYQEAIGREAERSDAVTGPDGRTYIPNP